MMENTKRHSVETAAEYLGISKSQMYKLTSTGEIKHYKPGGKKIILFESDLNDYIQSGEVKTNNELEQEAANYLVQ